jgi:hypothetical protein
MNTANLITYPIGHTYVFDSGVAEIEQHYQSTERMHCKVLTGPRAGAEETLAIDIKLLRPNVFLVSWQARDKTTVVQVEDFDAGVFFSNVTLPDAMFRRFTGKMRRVS